MKKLLLGAILCGALSVICLHYFATITFTQSNVENSFSLQQFRQQELPGFIHQRPDSAGLIKFRQVVAPAVSAVTDPLAKAIAVRQWVRNQQSDASADWGASTLQASEDPLKLLDQQRRGYAGACRRFSYILVGALLSVGMDARMIVTTENFKDSGQMHSLVEVWIDPLSKWVLLDPTFDTLILVDGTPASAVDLYLAAKHPTQHRIAYERSGSQHLPVPRWEAYSGLLKHLYIAKTNAVFDGYSVSLFSMKRISFLHLVDTDNDPFPQKPQLATGVLAVLFACASAGLFLLLVTEAIGIRRGVKLPSLDYSTAASII